MLEKDYFFSCLALLLGACKQQPPQPIKIGLSIITFIDPDNQHQEYLDFSRNMIEHFSRPANASSTRSYEMVMILADALKRCKQIDVSALKNALLGGEYETLMGKVKFDRFGDVIRPVYEVTVKSGRFYNNGKI